MFSHKQMWDAIDALAARNGLSTSGLAKRAGLDATTFNKSKRVAADGRLTASPPVINISATLENA